MTVIDKMAWHMREHHSQSLSTHNSPRPHSAEVTQKEEIISALTDKKINDGNFLPNINILKDQSQTQDGLLQGLDELNELV